LVFFNGGNGAYPFAGLREGTDGNLYGTTIGGGPYTCNYGLGNLCGDGAGGVFKLTPQGNLTTWFVFNGRNGFQPSASLVQVSDGSFFGTTSWGGTNASDDYGAGTVFHLSIPGADSPKIITTALSGSNLSLTWLALVGGSYQLQFKTNLAQPNWSNSGVATTATNTVATVSDTIGPDRQRFYHVVLLP
jgi:hypothetical protein